MPTSRRLPISSHTQSSLALLLALGAANLVFHAALQGVVLKMEERRVISTLRQSDDSAAVSELKPVTRYERQDMRPANRVETINSFAVTPDGQVIGHDLANEIASRRFCCAARRIVVAHA